MQIESEEITETRQKKLLKEQLYKECYLAVRLISDIPDYTTRAKQLKEYVNNMQKRLKEI